MSGELTISPELHATLLDILKRLKGTGAAQALSELDQLRAQHQKNHPIGLQWCGAAIQLGMFVPAINYATHMLSQTSSALWKARWLEYIGTALMMNGEFRLAASHYEQTIDQLSLLGASGQFPIQGPDSQRMGRLDEQSMAAIEDRLWQLLAAFKSEGLHVFPMYGTLLGFERGGSLLPFDKDVDLGVWLEDLHGASAVMKKMGMQASRSSPPFNNYFCYTDPQTAATFDLLAMRREPENRRMITGFWLYDKPADHQKIGHLPWFDLVDKPGPHGPTWWPDNPDAILTAIYDQWRIPQPEFDTAISAANMQSRGLLQHRCFAYSRLINRWFAGDMPRTQRYLDQALRYLPDDQTLLRARAMFEQSNTNAAHD